MCLEDLRLGRGRYSAGTTNLVSLAPTTFQPNSRRVALVISFSGVSTFDPAGPTIIVDIIRVYPGYLTTGVEFVSMAAPGGVLVLRIEDLGQLITGAISAIFVNNSTFGRASITEIVTDVIANPIGFDQGK